MQLVAAGEGVLSGMEPVARGLVSVCAGKRQQAPKGSTRDRNKKRERNWSSRRTGSQREKAEMGLDGLVVATFLTSIFCCLIIS